MAAFHPARISQNRTRRFWLSMLVVAWGIQVIVTQSLLLREALVLMFGSELAWGIVLSAWLAGVAVGGSVGGWLSRRIRQVDLTLVAALVLLSVAACVELWAFRGARAWLGVGPGELLPLPKMALAALVLVTPVSGLVGLAFPLACCVLGERQESELLPVTSLGSIYASESAGSLIGGAAFSFWAVETLFPIETILLCGAITIVACGALLMTTRANRRVAFALGVLAGAMAAVALLAGDTLHRRLVERRWRDIAPAYELRAEVESKYQNLMIGQLAEQFTLYCDGQVSATFPDPYSLVPLAHFWMCQHPAPRHVLMLGGGVGGILAEVLRHPVEHVDYVEPDSRQIELVKPYLSETARKALQDPRVSVIHMDARYLVKTRRDCWDLVIAQLPEPMSALRARFYTDEFYRELRRAMTEQSVLCTTVAATPGGLSAASADYIASIRATLGAHFPEVIVGWGDPAQVLAATRPGLVSTDPVELTRRYMQRHVQSPIFDPLWFEGATDWLDADKVKQRSKELDDAHHVEVSTDLRPFVYVQRLILWERMTAGGGAGSAIEWLCSIRWVTLVAILTTAGLVTFLAYPLRIGAGRGWAQGAIVLSILTTGFATMALSIALLFAFQNLYGYVYQRIGWIIAMFMAGLVIGCAAFQWRYRRAGERGPHDALLWRSLIVVDVLLAGVALLIPFVLPALGALQTTKHALVWVEAAVSVIVTVTGILGGASFALAGGLQLLTTRKVGTAAGSIVWADHTGACAGALLTGILLVPVFGTQAAAFLLVGMKLASAAMLAMGARMSQR